jgi:Flp pilus assembly protein TadG
MSCIERLGSDRRGIAATEFGLILPVFAMLLLGGFDLSHTIYMQGVMQGEVQKAARKSSLQSGTGTSTQAAIDAAVRSAVKNLNTSMSDSDIVITRRNYKSFAKARCSRAPLSRP